MIWGRTNAEVAAERDEWKPAFAWVPVRLWDGRWLWWEPYVWRDGQLVPGTLGVLMFEVTMRFRSLDEIEKLNEELECRISNRPPPPKRR